LSLNSGFALGEVDDNDDVWEFRDNDVDVAEDGGEDSLEMAMPEPDPYAEPKIESIKKVRQSSPRLYICYIKIKCLISIINSKLICNCFHCARAQACIQALALKDH
jgi:hypothetical protein